MLTAQPCSKSFLPQGVLELSFLAVTCPSGRRCNSRKVVWVKVLLGFKTPRHRHVMSQDIVDIRTPGWGVFQELFSPGFFIFGQYERVGSILCSPIISPVK